MKQFNRVREESGTNNLEQFTPSVSGQLVETKGYYEPDDGGGATYIILTDAEYDGTPDGYADHQLSNGFVAKLMVGDLINPLTCGAVGDGVTDDSEAYAVVLSKNKPIIAPDTYLVSQRFTTETLVMSGGGTFNMADITTGFMTVTGSDSLVEGMNFHGAATTGQATQSIDTCFEFNNYDATNNVVRNCFIKDFAFIGIFLKSKSSHIESNNFENIGHLAALSVNRFNYITKNTFISCGNNDALYTGGVISVTYYQPDGYTLATTLGERNYILNNTISTSKQVGIDTHSGYGLIIKGNVISDCDLEAIYLHRSSVEDYTDEDGRVYNCVVTNNSIKNCLNGVLLSSFEADDSIERTCCINNLISDNIIENPGSWGVALARGSKNNVVQGNKVSGARIGIYVFYWSSDNVVKANTVEATNNSVRLIELNAANLYSTDNNVIDGNTLNFNDQSNVRGILNRFACDSTFIKYNEFINRGNWLPILDEEAGTTRQARIVHKPRGYTAASSAIREISDMQGEVIENMLPTAGGNRGWVCITSGDEDTVTGVWNAYGAIDP